MNRVVLIALVLGLGGCTKEEVSAPADNSQAAPVPATTNSFWNPPKRPPYSFTPNSSSDPRITTYRNFDAETGCEYLISSVNGGYSITIRYDHYGRPMCPDVGKSPAPAKAG